MKRSGWSVRGGLMTLLATGLLLAIVVYSRRGDEPLLSASEPHSLLVHYREAVAEQNSRALQALLADSLRHQTDTLLERAQNRLAQSVSWVIVETQTEGAGCRLLVHEMGRDGWIYPVRYELVRQGETWKIRQVTELSPEKAPIAPGTHISEVLGQTPGEDRRVSAQAADMSAESEEEETAP
ncbi:hypothetical protein HRbin36_00791 [bacterium HR36]|nr:hypothetical protein HRbin36_00791 [bacterium HR36]